MYNKHGSLPESAALSTGLQMLSGSAALLLMGLSSGELGHLRVWDFVLPFSGSEIHFETLNPMFSVHGCDFNINVEQIVRKAVPWFQSEVRIGTRR